jgi:hypothetical protein
MPPSTSPPQLQTVAHPPLATSNAPVTK